MKLSGIRDIVNSGIRDPVNKINEVEVLCMVNKIKRRKAAESEGLSMKVWKVLGENVVK